MVASMMASSPAYTDWQSKHTPDKDKLSTQLEHPAKIKICNLNATRIQLSCSLKQQAECQAQVIFLRLCQKINGLGNAI